MSTIMNFVYDFFVHIAKFFRGMFHSDIPGPAKIPLVGNLKEAFEVFASNPHTTLTARKKMYGSMYQFNVLGVKILQVFDPRLIEDIRKVEGQYPIHLEFKHLIKYRSERKYPLGLLVSNGEEWKDNRKALAKHLLGYTPNFGYVQMVETVSKEIIATLAARGTELNAVDLTPIIKDFVVKVMCRVFFGENFEDFCAESIGDFMRFYDITRNNFKLVKFLLVLPKFLWPISGAWKQHSAGWDFLLKTIEHVVAKFTEQLASGRADLTCVMAHLCKQRLMPDSEMFINVTDLVLASMEMCRVTILWVVYDLARNPLVQESIVKESNEHCLETDKENASQLKDVTWIEAAVRESMRLHPAAHFLTRKLTEDATINNYKVSANTQIFVSTYMMGRDEKMFPQPDVFNPERWMNGNDELEMFNKHVTFGFGKRSCIGRRIAESVIQSFALEMCKQIKFEMSDNKPVKTVFRLLAEPDRALKITARRRSHKLTHFGGSIICDSMIKKQDTFTIDDDQFE